VDRGDQTGGEEVVEGGGPPLPGIADSYKENHEILKCWMAVLRFEQDVQSAMGEQRCSELTSGFTIACTQSTHAQDIIYELQASIRFLSRI
jgi:hypothetical protein